RSRWRSRWCRSSSTSSRSASSAWSGRRLPERAVSDGLLPPPAAASTLRSVDGTRLHALRWPAERPRAALLLSHGLGEHAGRYAALARDLVPRGFDVHALDHRGHGRSGGARAYIPRFSTFVDDFELFRLHVAA